MRSLTTRFSKSCSSLKFPTKRFFAGDHRGEEIPVPIPNTEVKLSIAEGSAGLARARVGRRRLFFLPSMARRSRTFFRSIRHCGRRALRLSQGEYPLRSSRSSIGSLNYVTGKKGVPQGINDLMGTRSRRAWGNCILLANSCNSVCFL